jgi:hypothetical protein
LLACFQTPLQTIRECLLLLSKLMEGWLRLLQEQRLSSSSLATAAAADSTSTSSSLSRSSGRIEQQRQQVLSSSREAAAAAGMGAGSIGPAAVPSSSSRSSSLVLDVHRLEGVLFMLLCSYDEAIRGDALSLLGLTRLLHQELQSLAQQMNIKLGAAAAAQQQQQAGAGAAAAGNAAAAGASSSSNALAGLSSSFTSIASGVQDSVASLSVGAGAAAAGAAAAAAVAASGGSGSGGGFFFRHKPTMSRDSFEFMQTLGECSHYIMLVNIMISCSGLCHVGTSDLVTCLHCVDFLATWRPNEAVVTYSMSHSSIQCVRVQRCQNRGSCVLSASRPVGDF